MMHPITGIQAYAMGERRSQMHARLPGLSVTTGALCGVHLLRSGPSRIDSGLEEPVGHDLPRRSTEGALRSLDN